jgi:hypothetical protein
MAVQFQPLGATSSILASASVYTASRPAIAGVTATGREAGRAGAEAGGAPKVVGQLTTGRSTVAGAASAVP